MHLFILVPGLVLLSASLVTAFGVFFAASHATGWLKTFGNAVGIWVLVMGALAIVLATIGAFSPRHHFRAHRGHYGMTQSGSPSIAPESAASAR